MADEHDASSDDQADPVGTAAALRAGLIAVLPILVGVVPFGLVYGAAAAEAGFDPFQIQGLSILVFAGASQIAAVDLLTDGAPVAVAVLTVWVINARMLMYSAALAPHLAHLPMRDRLAGAYLLTDQAFAVAIARWETPQAPGDRLPYYAGAGLGLWSTWQATTIIGAVIGDTIPESVPLTFAIPLAFLALLTPQLTNIPNLAAAVVAGMVAVAVAEIGYGEVSVLAGATAGIVSGSALTWGDMVDADDEPVGPADAPSGPDDEVPS